jgi:hypothetical protein
METTATQTATETNPASVDITPATENTPAETTTVAAEATKENTAVKHTGKKAAKKPAAKKAAKVKAAPKAKAAKAPKAKAAPKAKRTAGVKAQGQVAKEAFRLLKAMAKEKGVSPAEVVRLAVHKYVGFKEAA